MGMKNTPQPTAVTLMGNCKLPTFVFGSLRHASTLMPRLQQCSALPLRFSPRVPSRASSLNIYDISPFLLIYACLRSISKLIRRCFKLRLFDSSPRCPTSKTSMATLSTSMGCQLATTNMGTQFAMACMEAPSTVLMSRRG